MRRRRFRGSCVLIGLLAAALPSAAAAEGGYWPQFRGPNRDGVSREAGLLRAWPEGGPPLLWSAEGIGHGFSSVSIAGGTIYTAGNSGGKTVITALDLQGRIRWQVPNGPEWTGTQPGQPGARSTPTVDGDRLFHLNPFGELTALEAASGRRLWGMNILDAFESQNITWALAASVLVDNQLAIVVPGGPRTAVVALDRGDGRTVWKSPSSGDLAGYGSPILVECQGLRMIVTLTSKAVIGVRAADGALLWRVEHDTRWDENSFTPIYHDGRLFVSTQFTGSRMLKLAVHGDQCAAEEVWRSTELDNHHGGVVLLDGCLYGSGRANAGRWACLDWNTGAVRYMERGVGKGSVVAAEGMLYTLSERGLAGLVKATPAAHELVSQFQIPDKGKGPVFAHPVVCGARLYLRHGDWLYCYDIRRK